MADYMINRTDGAGRSVYLQDRPASAPTVIFTGAPGLGKSYALDRAVQAARESGDLVLKIDAGSREPLEKRLARAVHDQYNELAETNGDRLLTDIGRVADRLLGDRGRWAERALSALAPVLQRAISWWEAPAKPSLTELIDRLGDLAHQRNKRLLLAVDNLGPAQDRDLADIAGLAEHLQSSRRPIQLVVGASGPAVEALLTADSPDAAAKIDTRYDIRECAPIPDTELRRALLASLHQQGATVRPDGATRLVHEANGDPGRLMALAAHAAALAASPRGVNRAVAEETIRTRRGTDQWAYRASWAGLSDAARVIVASAAARANGVALAEPPVPSDARAWVDRAQTVADLVDAGVLRRSGEHLTISDPGFQQWVTTSIAPHPEPTSVGKTARRSRGTDKSQTATRARPTPAGTAAGHPGQATKAPRSTTGRTTRTAPTTTLPKPRSTTTARRRTRVAAGPTRGSGRG